MRRRAAAVIEAIHGPKGTVLLEIGADNQVLHLIRRGAVDSHDKQGNLVGRYGEGDCFDLRAVSGDRAFAAQISEALGQCGSGQGKALFLSALARQAASYDVPLGFFRRFVLDSEGEHKETLEIKAPGLMLTDLVRVRALQDGVTVPATQDRLAQLQENGEMTRKDADRLAGAHRLLAGLRVRLHADLVRRGEEPHSHLDVKAISHAEQAARKDAFLVIREAQKGLSLDFPS